MMNEAQFTCFYFPKVSSRSAMIGSLTDGSTETFWESGDEDRNKSKWVSASVPVGSNVTIRGICVHVDNGRDLGNKVSSICFKSGKGQEDCSNVVRQADVESRFAGWISCFLNSPDHHLVRVELKGPDNTLRIRQVRVLGGPRGEADAEPPAATAAAAAAAAAMVGFPGGDPRCEDASSIQQRNCETETLRVFRLITGQVYNIYLLHPKCRLTIWNTRFL